MSKVGKNQDTHIHIRIEEELKNRFVELTKQQGDKYSKVLRELILDYVKRYKE